MVKENVKNFLKEVCLIEDCPDELLDGVNALLGDLSDREERIIRLRYGLDDGKCRTLLEVSEEFGVTRETIRQVEATAIKKLRHPTRTKRFFNNSAK